MVTNNTVKKIGLTVAGCALSAGVIYNAVRFQRTPQERIQEARLLNERAEARREADKKVAEKLREGYTLVHNTEEVSNRALDCVVHGNFFEFFPILRPSETSNVPDKFFLIICRTQEQQVHEENMKNEVGQVLQSN